MKIDKNRVLELKAAVIEAEALASKRLMEYVREFGIPDKNTIEAAQKDDIATLIFENMDKNIEDSECQGMASNIDLNLYNKVLKLYLDLLSGTK